MTAFFLFHWIQKESWFSISLLEIPPVGRDDGAHYPDFLKPWTVISRAARNLLMIVGVTEVFCHFKRSEKSLTTGWDNGGNSPPTYFTQISSRKINASKPAPWCHAGSVPKLMACTSMYRATMGASKSYNSSWSCTSVSLGSI